jgi:hypothetical protein
MQSTLKRPDARILKSFHAGQVGNDTPRTYLEKGWSLAICCKDCPRLIEWTPPALATLFAANLDVKIAHLVPRLRCSMPEGCGSVEIAVFAHAYDGQWAWEAPEGA